MDVREIKAEIAAVSAEWVLIATNSGTYSAVQACSATGSGDPRYNDWRVYERVGDGVTRREGPTEECAPGYARWSRVSLASRRRALADLRAQLKGHRHAP